MIPEKSRYDAIIEEVALKHGLPVKVVDRTYRAFWVFVRDKVTSLPLKQPLTEEESNNLRTSINIPSLGKFYCDYEQFSRIKKRLEYVKALKENDD